jgi:hypothetical protein
MRICYVDEAGCTGMLPAGASDIQPVFVLCGVDFRAEDLSHVTHDFLHLKRRYFPALSAAQSHYLGLILPEIKGSDVRKQATCGSRRRSRHAVGFIESVVRLVEKYHGRLYGRVWVKAPGHEFNGRSVYTFSLQYICHWFNHRLHADDSHGMIICDSRNKALNSIASHSVFTQKFQATGDAFPRIAEMPAFGHSENHAGVQIADLICSALLVPLAIEAYCRGRLSGTHMRDYSVLRERFAARLEALQHRCANQNGKLCGGVTVDDKVGKKARALMFSPGARHSLGMVLPKPRKQPNAVGGLEAPAPNVAG